jgi:hypothetical protein
LTTGRPLVRPRAQEPQTEQGEDGHLSEQGGPTREELPGPGIVGHGPEPMSPHWTCRVHQARLGCDLGC